VPEPVRGEAEPDREPAGQRDALWDGLDAPAARRGEAGGAGRGEWPHGDRDARPDRGIGDDQPCRAAGCRFEPPVAGRAEHAAGVVAAPVVTVIGPEEHIPAGPAVQGRAPRSAVRGRPPRPDPATRGPVPGRSRAPGEPPTTAGHQAPGHRTSNPPSPPHTRGFRHRPALRPGAGRPGAGRAAGGGPGRADGHDFAGSSRHCPSAGRPCHAADHGP